MRTLQGKAKLANRALCVGAMALLLHPHAPAAAQQDDTSLELPSSESHAPSSESLAQAAEHIPARDWYPEGYYDIRLIAYLDAVAQRQPSESYLVDWSGDGIPTFSLPEIGCEIYDPWNDPQLDDLTSAQIYLAYDLAAMEQDLVRAGYPRTMFEPLLIEYEREQLAGMESDYKDRTFVEPESYEYDDSYVPLMARLEAARKVQAPELPAIEGGGGCGDGEDRPLAIVRTVPDRAEVWMISAFAFRACSLRQDNPWDPFACRWSEIETGVSMPMIGRYVYRVRWPDGTEKRGTRDLPYPTSDDFTNRVTLRR